MAKRKTFSESAAWEAIIGFLDQIERAKSTGQRGLEVDRARALAVEMLVQVKEGFHENPPLLIWPNPGKSVTVRLDEQLSRRAYELAYKHREDGLDYNHDFTSGVAVWTGTVGRKRCVLLERPDGRELWADF